MVRAREPLRSLRDRCFLHGVTRRLRRLANSYDPWRGGQGGGLPYKAQGDAPGWYGSHRWCREIRSRPALPRHRPPPRRLRPRTSHRPGVRLPQPPPPLTLPPTDWKVFYNRVSIPGFEGGHSEACPYPPTVAGRDVLLHVRPPFKPPPFEVIRHHPAGVFANGPDSLHRTAERFPHE